MKNRGTNFICEDCTIVFQVYKLFSGTPRIYCPTCGDYVSVRRYVSPKITTERTRLKWTDHEVEIIDKCLKGELTVYQVAIMLGRSSHSVSQKIYRMKDGK